MLLYWVSSTSRWFIWMIMWLISNATVVQWRQYILVICNSTTFSGVQSWWQPTGTTIATKAVWPSATGISVIRLLVSAFWWIWSFSCWSLVPVLAMAVASVNWQLPKGRETIEERNIVVVTSANDNCIFRGWWMLSLDTGHTSWLSWFCSLLCTI